MSDDSEAKLIQRAKRGDAAAFAEIYDQCQPAIYRYILSKVKDVPTAEDLTGEVFVRLVEKIDTFTYQGRPLLAWLYTIGRNLVTDYYRRANRFLPLQMDKQLSGDLADVEETVERRVRSQEVFATLSHLTEGQRQVILLKFIEGLDNAAVASILGKSVNAVKALQHRGLASLQRIMEKDEQ